MAPKLSWKSFSNGNFPPKAFRGGFDGDDNLLVIRANVDGGLIPGKFHVSHDKGYIPLNGKEHSVSNYEVLVAKKGSIKWKKSSCGQSVEKAIAGGTSAEGEALFIGRVQHLDTISIGKVHPSHGVCYVPYGGEELSFADYEILVTTKHRGHYHGRRSSSSSSGSD